MTIRNIPADVRKRLEKIAKREKKSLNQVAVEAMGRAVGFDPAHPQKYRDLSFMFKGVTAEDIKAIDDAVAWSDAADLQGQKDDEQTRQAHRAGYQPLSRSRRKSA